MLHGTVYKSWIRPQKSSEKANDELQGNFILLVIWFKIQSFTSCTYNYALCNLIPALRLGSYPAPHNKEKSPRTPDPLSHVQWGSGQRKNLVTLKVETRNENWILMACDIDGMCLILILKISPAANTGDKKQDPASSQVFQKFCWSTRS